MIEEIRECRTHRVVVLGAHHDIAVGMPYPPSQRLERGRRLPRWIGEMRLERLRDGDVERVHQFGAMPGGDEVGTHRTRHAQPEPRRARRRTVPDRADNDEEVERRRHQVIARRTAALTHSLTITVAKITRRIIVTCGQASTFSEDCSFSPRPPAPTRPSTALSRMLISQRNTEMPQKAGAICGQVP